MDLNSIIKPRESKIVPGLYYKSVTVGKAIEFDDMVDRLQKELSEEEFDKNRELEMWLVKNVFCDKDGKLSEVKEENDIPAIIQKKIIAIIVDVWGGAEQEEKKN